MILRNVSVIKKNFAELCEFNNVLWLKEQQRATAAWVCSKLDFICATMREKCCSFPPREFFFPSFIASFFFFSLIQFNLVSQLRADSYSEDGLCCLFVWEDNNRTITSDITTCMKLSWLFTYFNINDIISQVIRTSSKQIFGSNCFTKMWSAHVWFWITS